MYKFCIIIPLLLITAISASAQPYPRDVLGQMGQRAIDVPKEKREPRSNGFVGVSMGVYPYLSYGVHGGWVGTYAGVYAKARSNFRFAKGTCSSDGQDELGGELWTSGKQAKSRLSVTAGGLIRATDWMFPYIGAGYGTSSVLWQDYDGNWMRVSDYDRKGITAELGMMFQFKHITLSAGINTTAFKYIEGEIGLGFMF